MLREMKSQSVSAAGESLGSVLRTAVASGRYDAVGELLAGDAFLDSSSAAGRRRIHGREAIVAHLEAPGPGDVLLWDAQEWPSGVAVTFEWRGADDVDRRRWYVRSYGGQIRRFWSYAARSRDDSQVSLSEAVLQRMGTGARRAAFEHSGNSGASLERVMLADGTNLIAKRVGPASDWLGRVTRDRGRTPLLWEAGAFDRMPETIDHGIEAVIADGDGWWVMMRDLSATFLGDERVLSRAENRRVLSAGAALHAEFAGQVPDGAAALGDRLGMSSPRVAAEERAGTDLLPKQLEAAWEAFADSVPSDVGDEVLRTANEELQVGFAKVSLPRGAIHGDLFCDNVLFEGDRVSGVIDFGFAATDFLDIRPGDRGQRLVRRCRRPGRARSIPERVEAMAAAYTDVRPVTPEERAMWAPLLRAGALRFWLSRLYDLHLPGRGDHLAHDPAVFERILRDRIASPPRLPES